MPNHSRLKFINPEGSFSLDSPEDTSYLYFPLANAAGMISSITPSLGGDAKTGQDTYLLTPVSVEDLHLSRSTRNFWVHKSGGEVWSATGVSAGQISHRYTREEQSRLEAGFLWHRMIRGNPGLGLKSEITTFVPCNDDAAELTKIVITNISDQDMTVTPTAAVPIYGRSADNLRSHRHVTSLLQRAQTTKYGIRVNPTLLFDERGHSVNRTAYAVYGSDGEGNPPVGFFPDMERFVGEGGTLDWPQAVVLNQAPAEGAGALISGFETIGALRFAAVTLHPQEQAVYILALCINPDAIEKKYLSQELFDRCLKENQSYWVGKLNINFHTQSEDFNRWMKWVSCEPILRRICGCSFLPYHDYGRGGRGWRDLWQDCIALLMMEPERVGSMLYRYCAGIRFDGTNATIIGPDGGSFLADRNQLVRVWMDHAAWPLNTIELYLKQSGDFDFLLKEQTYFKDSRIRRCKQVDPEWNDSRGKALLDPSGKPYQGTILEHLLIENLTACLDVGKHGMLRLENADWNDALDMAAENGESVAFSSMYCGNLRILAELLEKLKEKKKITYVLLAREVGTLLQDGEDNSPTVLRKQLDAFCNQCDREVSGEKDSFEIDGLIAVLLHKADRLAKKIIRNEQVRSSAGFTWLNGYYDNSGRAVEGETDKGVRMTLAGQVFAVMYGIADRPLTENIVRAAEKYLFDESGGGYRLNTDFQELKTDLGRQFGFAYGHKENGAVFSHMMIMFVYALYTRGFVKEGYRALKTLCGHCMDFEKSLVYPGIPEYMDPRGRGMYPYLTGAASWMVLTCLTQVFGIRGDYDGLVFSPKLLREQFGGAPEVSCEFQFRGRKFHVFYHNPLFLDYGEYSIASAELDGTALQPCRLGSEQMEALAEEKIHIIHIYLGRTVCHDSEEHAGNS